jgi:hypothetical protein
MQAVTICALLPLTCGVVPCNTWLWHEHVGRRFKLLLAAAVVQAVLAQADWALAGTTKAWLIGGGRSGAQRCTGILDSTWSICTALFSAVVSSGGGPHPLGLVVAYMPTCNSCGIQGRSAH